MEDKHIKKVRKFYMNRHKFLSSANNYQNLEIDPASFFEKYGMYKEELKNQSYTNDYNGEFILINKKQQFPNTKSNQIKYFIKRFSIIKKEKKSKSIQKQTPELNYNLIKKQNESNNNEIFITPINQKMSEKLSIYPNYGVSIKGNLLPTIKRPYINQQKFNNKKVQFSNLYPMEFEGEFSEITGSKLSKTEFKDKSTRTDITIPPFQKNDNYFKNFELKSGENVLSPIPKYKKKGMTIFNELNLYNKEANLSYDLKSEKKNIGKVRINDQIRINSIPDIEKINISKKSKSFSKYSSKIQKG